MGDLFEAVVDADAPVAKPKLTTRNPEKYIEYYEKVCAQLCDKTPEEMRRLAYENTLTAWLNNHPVAGSTGHCAHCGKSEGTLLPYGAGYKREGTYLHANCWRPWFVGRRRDAAEALREMGIMASGVR